MVADDQVQRHSTVSCQRDAQLFYSILWFRTTFDIGEARIRLAPIWGKVVSHSVLTTLVIIVIVTIVCSISEARRITLAARIRSTLATPVADV
jgi:hypothetical protein